MKSTKEKLLNTAEQLFAKHGLDGVSTRDLAGKAKVNLCAITYYFGSKQKLYEAVIEEIVSFISDNFVKMVLPTANQSSPFLSPRDKIKNLIRLFFSFICSEKISGNRAELLIREILNPSPAYVRFYETIMEPIHKHLSALIAQDTGLPETNFRTVLLSHTLFGQTIMFRIHKEALLRRLNLKKYTPELTAEIQKLLLCNCDAILDGAREN